jgi:hypothetical protein
MQILLLIIVAVILLCTIGLDAYQSYPRHARSLRSCRALQVSPRDLTFVKGVKSVLTGLFSRAKGENSDPGKVMDKETTSNIVFSETVSKKIVIIGIFKYYESIV